MKRRNVMSILSFAVAVLVLGGLLFPLVPPAQALAPSSSSRAAAALAPVAAQATPAPADDWARVKAAGKLVVGTALDNPPFSTNDESFQPYGYDIALMTEMARRMGVQVEFTDFAFEGLLGAVRLKQVDAAIAAITITPERQSVVDFTTPYFFGNDGILAKSDSAITAIVSVADLAPRRVAVQRGSAYEKALQNTVIKTGQMLELNLLSYAKPEHAVRDVTLNRADLAILDRATAEDFIGQGGVKLVGQGLFPQSYGIAVAKDSTLLEQLNRALAQVQSDGTGTQLIEKYLEASLKPPTPTPTPTPEPCIDGMAWVADLNYDDKNMKAPPVMDLGQSFKKGWRIRNSGTCDWDPTFTLSYVYGNVPGAGMGGQPVQVGKTVAPGQTVDLYANLVAPKVQGLYQGFWQMSNAQDVPFGQKIWVGIQAGVPPTPVPPPPTAVPQPGIEFGIDRTTINAGECVNLWWRVQNVKAVYVYPQGADINQYGVAGEASRQECPGGTTTYELRVVKPDDSLEFRQIQVTVNQTAAAPAIQYYNAEPRQIRQGQCVNLSWQIAGDVNRVALVRSGQPIWDYAPTGGSYNDCPPDARTYEYKLQAWGPGGFVENGIGVEVGRPIQPR